MTLPFSGPFSSSGTTRQTWWAKKIYRQARPYDLPLPYEMYRYFSWGFGSDSDSTGYYANWEGKGSGFSALNHPTFNRSYDAAYSQCYERLKALLGDSAGWAENIAQIQKTRESLVGRCVQAAHFASAVKQHRFKDAARILRTPKPSNVSTKKAVSQNVLEYEYGLKPLISDINNSLVILTSEPRVRRFRAKGYDSQNDVSVNSYSTGTNPVNSSYAKLAWQYELQVQIGAEFRVVNPDLYLASRLGLIDVALPWKLIPFSFVIDWFVNVEQVISSLTDWYGLFVDKPYVTTFARSFQNYNTWGTTVYSSGYTYYTTGTVTDESVELKRAVGAIPAPDLVVKPFKGFSLQRGTQAIALVLSVFGK